MQTFLYIVSGQALAVMLTLLTLFLVARVLRRQQRPGSSIAWILGIVLLPYVGIPAFIIFGGRKIHGLKKRKRRLYTGLQEAPVRLLDFDNPAEDVLTSQSVHPPSGQNEVDFVSDGQEAYHKLIEMLEGAQRSIYVETYILARDDVARTFVELLARKAGEGLDVRLLLDSYGSLGATGRFVQSIREAGGKVEKFMPLMPFRRNWSLNLRNHRKIFIVDCSVATIGGMNIGTEYMGPEPNPKRWLDTATFVRGPSVLDLLEVFSTDWNFASADPLEFDRACLSTAAESSASGVLQVAASGPDVDGDPVYEAILTSIYAVRERVWLVTPYFVPGEELFRALLLQARIGRDVRLILPAKSNHWLADLARGRYIRALQSAGGKVYLCRHRMIHAKNIVFDEDTAVIGTLNIDMRSLYLNFELAV
ncbi:MAG: PLDc N-terminal domain-containing protein, partial [Candidatus Hydrogenedentes bacterium]|nr:PLDc N-terminal domain-containing protein [Candidatus Hydrogenedentota bacterium]